MRNDYAVRFLPDTAVSDIFLIARRMHETLLLDLARSRTGQPALTQSRPHTAE
jgi:hypothetical protein